MPRRPWSVGLSVALVIAGTGVAAGQTGPAPGTPVDLVSTEGQLLGTVTVGAIHDPFTGLRDARTPDPGTRVVLVDLTFEGDLEGGFELSPSRVLLRDSTGALWERAFPPVPDDYPLPELSSTEIGPGSRLGGYVGYTIPADAQADEVYFAPAEGILLRVADALPVEPPALDTAVTVPGADGSQSTGTVRAVADPYTGFREDRGPGAGSRFVMVTVSFENTGSVPFGLEPSGVVLSDTRGRLWGRTQVEPAKKPKVPELDSVDLAPGNLVTGRVGFQVPADAVLEGVQYQGGGHLMLLAGLAGVPFPTGSSAPGASPGTPAASASPATEAVGCDVIAPWWAGEGPILERLVALPWFQAETPAMDLAASRKLLKDISALRASQAKLAPPAPLVDVHRRILGALILYQESASMQVDAQKAKDRSRLPASREAFEAAQLVMRDGLGALDAVGFATCGL